jgi:hypothetical protein
MNRNTPTPLMGVLDAEAPPSYNHLHSFDHGLAARLGHPAAQDAELARDVVGLHDLHRSRRSRCDQR